MPIVQTRFRDVDLPEGHAGNEDTPGYLGPWSKIRGTPVEIRVPAVNSAAINRKYCEGPFFWLATRPGIAVCPCLVEIGD